MLYFKEISTCCGPALSVALNNKSLKKNYICQALVYAKNA
jgi:hypothetical protein